MFCQKETHTFKTDIHTKMNENYTWRSGRGREKSGCILKASHVEMVLMMAVVEGWREGSHVPHKEMRKRRGSGWERLERRLLTSVRMARNFLSAFFGCFRLSVSCVHDRNLKSWRECSIIEEARYICLRQIYLFIILYLFDCYKIHSCLFFCS